MKCENCGTPISKNDNYCPYCGCKNTDFDSSIKSNDVVAKKINFTY
ncbi:MAG: zinc-ribbon domain-containing protein [Clostridia bacterium]|nr:zinc-ribbon domain-containing protein [Clostridia bacterium]